MISVVLFFVSRELHKEQQGVAGDISRVIHLTLLGVTLLAILPSTAMSRQRVYIKMRLCYGNALYISR